MSFSWNFRYWHLCKSCRPRIHRRSTFWATEKNFSKGWLFEAEDTVLQHGLTVGRVRRVWQWPGKIFKSTKCIHGFSHKRKWSIRKWGYRGWKSKKVEGHDVTIPRKFLNAIFKHFPNWNFLNAKLTPIMSMSYIKGLKNQTHLHKSCS